MAHRIEVSTIVNDTRSDIIQKKLQSLGYKVSAAKVIDVYTINRDFSPTELETIASMLSNPISQSYLIDQAQTAEFNQALEIGFLPGVTDNIATTARETIEDRFKITFQGEGSVHTSQLILITGEISTDQAQEIGEELANKLIQRIAVKSTTQFKTDRGMDLIIPKVHLKSHPKTDQVDLDISDQELLKLSREGIPNHDGTRRGPLALSKDYLEAIKNYFQKEGRKPTDIELESIAQTWSEHCKHTIFAAEINELKDGLYKGYIKRATNEIRAAKGDKDFCVSVFSDNSGGIIFDENWVITDKAETHNSPSALDPFGGAVTGIVGVNRDCIGFGKGAKPIINKYGYCVGDPDDHEPIYRDKALTTPALPPKRILEGIIAGVNEGGNCSGIPTPQGFLVVDKGYKGKPLVFVGTIGLIPRKINGANSWEKQAQPGDKIVIVGGRVGQDGIHGATFSSEALSAGSPATAVQIGDPITQKKLSDALIKEARDQDLYTSITDCGAGGISCSIAEMARECGGCRVELDKVPLKYPNLEPWKIWISESQERITLSVPPEKIDQFLALMGKRGVEATVVGEFTAETRCEVNYNNEKIMDLDMEFLHDGLPNKHLKGTYLKPQNPEPNFQEPDLTDALHTMLSRKNICSFEFISRQYDHNVQGGSVLKPLQGKGAVNATATITKPFPETTRGIICSQGINPIYSAIDTYHMSACAIDTAIRNAVAVGADVDYMALMDNFCWCSSDEEQSLGELKEAVRACYEYAIAYGTPYISGKDSMFNDFKGFDKNANPIKISIPPTLLASSIAVLDDVTKAVSLDPKIPGDLIYILGETREELGGSEYFQMNNTIGNNVPKVNAINAKALYKAFRKAINQRMIASALSPAFGGLAIALAKKAIAGQLGMNIDLSSLPALNRKDYLLFSESQSRFIVTIDPKRQAEFEEHFKEFPHYQIGTITENKKFTIKGMIDTDVDTLNKHYHETFKNY